MRILLIGDESEQLQITCDICDRAFDTIADRNEHIEEHFQLVRCPVCGKTFTGDRAFEHHTSVGKCKDSVVVKRFRCIMCNAKVFDSKELLDTHVETVHNCIIGGEQLMCIQCDRTFAKFKYLKKHVTEVHEKMSQFSCDLCNKQFNRKANLTEHMLIHENKYTAQCPVCEKSYRTPSALRLHVRMHTKEKPYKCDMCGEKSYAYNTDLKRHKRSAHGILGKPYPCDVCSKVFYEPKLLKNHKKRCHRVDG